MAKQNSLKGMTVLITSGPTREFWDPVRYLSNASSGRMGCLLARAARRRGARVELIAGPGAEFSFPGIRLTAVTSARQMLDAVKKRVRRAAVFVAAAAVSDFRPARLRTQKLEKRRFSAGYLELVRNPDILAWVGRRKKRPLILGFALESRNLAKRAMEKLRVKNADMIVGNDVSALGSDSATYVYLDRSGTVERWGRLKKPAAAERILNRIAWALAAQR